MLHGVETCQRINSPETGHPTETGIVVEALPYCTPDKLKQIDLPAGQPRMEMIFRFPSFQRHLPPGIPTWGIARAHRFSKFTPWRDAAFFEDRETNSQAIILASDALQEIRLRVAADYPPFFFGRMEAILRTPSSGIREWNPSAVSLAPASPDVRLAISLKRL